ncbi:hypothetical protein JCM10207_003430 [Rhodosporidiobolus poonsookiae]
MTALDTFLSDIGAPALSTHLHLQQPSTQQPPAQQLYHRIQTEIDAVNDETVTLIKDSWDDFSSQLKQGDELIKRLEDEDKELLDLEDQMDGENAFLPPLVAQLEAHRSLAASHLLSTTSVALLTALLTFHTTVSSLSSATTSGALPAAVDALRSVTAAVDAGAKDWIEETPVWRALVRWAGEEESRLGAALQTALEACFDIVPASASGGANLTLREHTAAAPGPNAERLAVAQLLEGLEAFAQVMGGKNQAEGAMVRLAKGVLRHFVAPFLEANGRPVALECKARLAFEVRHEDDGVHVATLAPVKEGEEAKDALDELSGFLSFLTTYSSLFPSSTSTERPSAYAITLTAHLTPPLQSHLISSYLTPSLPSSTSSLPTYLALLSRISTFESTFLPTCGLFAFLPPSASQTEEARVLRSWAHRVPHHWARHVGDGALARVRGAVQSWDWGEGEVVEVEVREEDEMMGLLLGLGLAEGVEGGGGAGSGTVTPGGTRRMRSAQQLRELALETVPKGAKRQMTVEEALAPKPPRVQTPPPPPPPAPAPAPVEPEPTPAAATGTLKRGKLGAARIAPSVLPPRSPSPPPLFQGGDAPAPSASATTPVPPPALDTLTPSATHASPALPRETFSPLSPPAASASGIETTADSMPPEEVSSAGMRAQEYGSMAAREGWENAQAGEGEVKHEEEGEREVKEETPDPFSAEAEEEEEKARRIKEESVEPTLPATPHVFSFDGAPAAEHQEDEVKPFSPNDNARADTVAVAVALESPPAAAVPQAELTTEQLEDAHPVGVEIVDETPLPVQEQAEEVAPYEPYSYEPAAYQPPPADEPPSQQAGEADVAPYEPYSYEPAAYQPPVEAEPKQEAADAEVAPYEPYSYEPVPFQQLSPYEPAPAHKHEHEQQHDEVAPYELYSYEPAADQPEPAQQQGAYQPEAYQPAPAEATEAASTPAVQQEREQYGGASYDPYAYAPEPAQTEQVEQEQGGYEAQGYEAQGYEPSSYDQQAYQPSSYDQQSYEPEQPQQSEQTSYTYAPGASYDYQPQQQQERYPAYNASAQEQHDPYAPRQHDSYAPPQHDAYAPVQHDPYAPTQQEPEPVPVVVSPPADQPAAAAPPPPRASPGYVAPPPRASAASPQPASAAPPPRASAAYTPPTRASPAQRRVVSPSYPAYSAPSPSSSSFFRPPSRPSSAQSQNNGPVLNHIQQRFVSPPPQANPYAPLTAAAQVPPQVTTPGGSYLPANDPLFADLFGGGGAARGASKPAQGGANFFAPDPPGARLERSSSVSSQTSNHSSYSLNGGARPPSAGANAGVYGGYVPPQQQQYQPPAPSQQQAYNPYGYAPQQHQAQQGYGAQDELEELEDRFTSGYGEQQGQYGGYGGYGGYGSEGPAMRLRGGAYLSDDEDEEDEEESEWDSDEESDDDLELDNAAPVLRLRGGADLGEMDEDDGNRSADDWGFGDDAGAGEGEDDAWGFGDEETAEQAPSPPPEPVRSPPKAAPAQVRSPPKPAPAPLPAKRAPPPPAPAPVPAPRVPAFSHAPSASISSTTSTSSLSRSRPPSYAFSPSLAPPPLPSIGLDAADEEIEEGGDEWGFGDEELGAPSPAVEEPMEEETPFVPPQQLKFAAAPPPPAPPVPAVQPAPESSPHVVPEPEPTSPSFADDWGFGAEEEPAPVEEAPVVPEEPTDMLEYERAVEGGAEEVHADPPAPIVADEVVAEEAPVQVEEVVQEPFREPSPPPREPTPPPPREPTPPPREPTPPPPAPAPAAPAFEPEPEEPVEDDGWGIDIDDEQPADEEPPVEAFPLSNEPAALQAPVMPSPPLVSEALAHGAEDTLQPKVDAFPLGTNETLPGEVDEPAPVEPATAELELDVDPVPSAEVTEPTEVEEQNALTAPAEELHQPFPQEPEPEVEAPPTPQLPEPLPHFDVPETTDDLAPKKYLPDALASAAIDDAAEVEPDSREDDGWGLDADEEEAVPSGLVPIESFAPDAHEAETQEEDVPVESSLVNPEIVDDDGFADYTPATHYAEFEPVKSPYESQQPADWEPFEEPTDVPVANTAANAYEPFEEDHPAEDNAPLAEAEKLVEEEATVPFQARSELHELARVPPATEPTSSSDSSLVREGAMSSPEVIEHSDAWGFDGETARATAAADAGAEVLEATPAAPFEEEREEESVVQHELDRPVPHDDSAVEHVAHRPLVHPSQGSDQILLPVHDAHPQERTFSPPPDAVPAGDETDGWDLGEDEAAQEATAEAVVEEAQAVSPPTDDPFAPQSPTGPGAEPLEAINSPVHEEAAPPAAEDSAVQHLADRVVEPIPTAQDFPPKPLPAQSPQPQGHTFSPPAEALPAEEDAFVDDPWDLDPVEPTPAPAAEIFEAEELPQDAVEKPSLDVDGTVQHLEDRPIVNAPQGAEAAHEAQPQQHTFDLPSASVPASEPEDADAWGAFDAPVDEATQPDGGAEVLEVDQQQEDGLSLPPAPAASDSLVQHEEERQVVGEAPEPIPAAELQPQEHTFNVPPTALPDTEPAAGGDDGWGWDGEAADAPAAVEPVAAVKTPSSPLAESSQEQPSSLPLVGTLAAAAGAVAGAAASLVAPEESPSADKALSPPSPQPASSVPQEHTRELSGDADGWAWDGEEAEEAADREPSGAPEPSQPREPAPAVEEKPAAAPEPEAEPEPAGPAPPRKEHMMVSKRSQEIVKIAEEVLLEALEVASPTFDHPVFASATAPLLQTFVSLLSLYRATAAVHNSTLLASVPAIGMQFANDAEWIGREVERVWRASTEGKQLQVSVEQVKDVELAIQSTRQLGKDTRQKQIAIQRAALMESLDEAGGFLRTADEGRYSACERALQQVTHTLQRLALVWKPVVTPTALYTTLGGLVNEVLLRVLDEIEDQADISEEESIRLNKLCKMLHELETLFEGSETSVGREVPVWFKFVFLSELLEASMADILFLFDHGHLVDFSPQEIVKLIRALFSDSPLRNRNIEKVLRGHPTVVPDEEEGEEW